MKLAKAIYSSYTGISPVIAEELCHRASLESDQSANTIQEMARLHLYHLFDLMMEDIKQHRYTPLIVSDCHGDPVEFSSLPLTMYADMQITEYPTISEVLEQYYQGKIGRGAGDGRMFTVAAR